LLFIYTMIYSNRNVDMFNVLIFLSGRFMKRYLVLSFMLLTSAINMVAMEVRKNCDVCFEEKESDRFTPLSCCHYNESCTDCLLEIIKTSLQEKTTAHIVCPNRNCAKPITLHDMYVVTRSQPDVYKEFDAIAIQEWRDTHTKHCPTPDCAFSFINEGAKQDFECPQCKQTYCSNCLIKHSQYITCEHAQIVGNKTKEETANQEWLQKTTKACPQCKAPVEKNKGCNHMTCKCKHQFCWVCLNRWKSCGCPQFPADQDDIARFDNVIDRQPLYGVDNLFIVDIVQEAVQRLYTHDLRNRALWMPERSQPNHMSQLPGMIERSQGSNAMRRIVRWQGNQVNIVPTIEPEAMQQSPAEQSRLEEIARIFSDTEID
jgi:ariadne-1